jgi:hypothetical protein
MRIAGGGLLICSPVFYRVSGNFFGSCSLTVEPSPGLLSTSILPPWASAIWRAIESPRPAPPAARDGSARWKRSNMSGNWSSGIPTPVSETSSSAQPSLSLAVTVTLPPSGVYLLISA